MLPAAAGLVAFVRVKQVAVGVKLAVTDALPVIVNAVLAVELFENVPPLPVQLLKT
jgi:hypothetical protein